ncbi:hypothetical protein BGZ79_000746 [Entomortierella chlamydospora]|nr:hypothetical protein BGZ79_000746 [Entomortierella chlamydospora]
MKPRVIFPGWQFESYDPEIKARIRETIEEYFKFIGQTNAKAREKFIQGYEGYPYSMEQDFNTKYRDHLARGCIYLLTLTPGEDQYERMSPKDRLECEKGVLIKIGYTADLKKRLYHYQNDCKLGSVSISTFPWTPPDAGKGLGGLGLVHLLEKILHQIWTFEQRDVPCICGNIENNDTSVVNMTCHTEVFAFEREEDETREKAFSENLKLMEPHIMKWKDAIESLDYLYHEILDFQEKSSLLATPRYIL